MEISPFQKEYLSEASALFVQNLAKLRQVVPVLPDVMENVDHITHLLERLMYVCPGVVALDHGRVVGYIGWYLVNHFRDTDRKAAFCPEWAHTAAENDTTAIYRAMYRAASAQWAEAGCQTHAISLLAHDHAAQKAWFWNGFGLAVVDAVRPLTPVPTTSLDFCVRKASIVDMDMIAIMEAEHSKHYTQPPIFMPAKDYGSPAEFLEEPKNSIWVATKNNTLAGYIRFEGNNSGAADLVQSDKTIAITAAYTRPEYRGQGAAPQMLNAALEDYTRQGFTCCSVDFESFNPEAATFWMKYFEPVCLSVFRVPEA